MIGAVAGGAAGANDGPRNPRPCCRHGVKDCMICGGLTVIIVSVLMPVIGIAFCYLCVFLIEGLGLLLNPADAARGLGWL